MEKSQLEEQTDGHALIDTHAHLNFKAFKNDYHEVIKRALASGITDVVNVGSSVKTSVRAVEIAADDGGPMHAAAGIHPTCLERIHDLSKEMAGLRALVGSSEIVAIGETGLDFFHSGDNKEEQKTLFKRLLELADELGLPAIIHCRDAFEDLLPVLTGAHSRRADGLKGVVHCFSGTPEDARAVLNLGYRLSFTGNITYPQNNALRQVISDVPLDSIMLETDSPFLAPVPYRGRRNEPSYLGRVAKEIADIKGLAIDEVAKTTSKNARDLFAL